MLSIPEPLLTKWARWCWHKPPYIGLPLILGVFIIAIADPIYIIYLIIKYWGK